MDFGVEAQHLSAIFHGVNVNGLDIDMVGRSAKAYGAEMKGKMEGNPSFSDARNRQEIACGGIRMRCLDLTKLEKLSTARREKG
uniref:Uncharacterized protein n=1 Tax=Oryza glumipatula TaxID=40148 RepID=A0A0D9ZUA8_9ORYZ